ncbi:MAG: hypothetical protein DWQ06_11645 [Calditrichaeota bacterium]|nr:MAG: hypothetical protein DWQ06_11645 [Calditrichota bacterium]
MNTFKVLGLTALTASVLLCSNSFAGDKVSTGSKSLKLSGRIQLQHLFNNDIESSGEKTTNGFRIRRGRLQAKGSVNDFVSYKFQIEVRDNSPKLKDALGKIKLNDNLSLTVGQFHVPVWREELRSSGNLLLVERGAAAEFLADKNFSARHIGAELGVSLGFATLQINYSNGSGEGEKETAGSSKSADVNNGKLITSRVNVPVGEMAEIGLSVGFAGLGADFYTDDDDAVVSNKGNGIFFAPDFGIKLPVGIDIEGGLAMGTIDKDVIGATDDQSFTVFDLTARWGTKFDTIENFGGLDGFEFAAGFSSVEPNSEIDDDEELSIRFGPALNFGKKVRFQLNGEMTKPADKASDDTFAIRSQFTINF